MGSVIAFNSLKKTPAKELGLGFDNFVQPEHLNMRSATNDVLQMMVSMLSSLTKSKMMSF